MEREREREYLSSYLFVCVKERVYKFVLEAKQKCVCVCVRALNYVYVRVSMCNDRE